MRINSVAKMLGGSGRNLTFTRRLKDSEKRDYTKTIQEAMDYLGVKNRAMIIHGTSFPSKNYEQKIGSPYNNKEFIDFLKLHGFNSIQLGPTGKLNRGDSSPYSSSIFAKNPLFIDLSLLGNKEYGSILPKVELEKIIKKTKTSDNAWDKTDFNDAEEINDKAMKIAYQNFKSLSNNYDKMPKQTQELIEDFKDFKDENNYWLDYYSVLDVIANKYGTDYYLKWSEHDKNLISNVKKGNEEAIKEYKQIKKDNDFNIDFYKFKQFIIDKQSKADKRLRKDFVYISDLLVGASYFDELIYQDVFLKDYKIGAERGGLHNSPQLWNISLVNPDKLFYNDGSLAEGGKFIKLKLQKAIQDSQNIRIDHAMGLVDPYIYNSKTVEYDKYYLIDEKLVPVPSREKLEAFYLSQSNIPGHDKYKRIIPEIVLPTLKRAGIDTNEAVWEDLGDDVTGVFNKVFRHENHLPGISGLMWTRGQQASERNWSYIGCHDNPTVEQLIEEDYPKYSDAWNLDYLAGYLNPSPNRTDNRDSFRREIERNPKALAKAKFADLFRATKNIQIMFSDFFGINKRYNTPGTVNSDNWTLRLSSDYEDKYYKSLENKDSWAINMPEVLSIAVQAKEDMDFVENRADEKAANHLIKKLNHYADILKEKE